jgi:hypothetical protein
LSLIYEIGLSKTTVTGLTVKSWPQYSPKYAMYVGITIATILKLLRTSLQCAPKQIGSPRRDPMNPTHPGPPPPNVRAPTNCARTPIAGHKRGIPLRNVLLTVVAVKGSMVPDGGAHGTSTYPLINARGLTMCHRHRTHTRQTTPSWQLTMFTNLPLPYCKSSPRRPRRHQPQCQ